MFDRIGCVRPTGFDVRPTGLDARPTGLVRYPVASEIAALP